MYHNSEHNRVNVTKIKIFQYLQAKLALYPSGIPRSDPPSCEAPREPTIYLSENVDKRIVNILGTDWRVTTIG